MSDTLPFGPVRYSDPAVSHAAATARRPVQRDTVLSVVARLDGATAAQIVAGWPSPRVPQRNVVASRLTELWRQGLVATDGTRVGPEGQSETVYRATPKGLAADEERRQEAR